jgi:excisionase family DNA binding protein
MNKNISHKDRPSKRLYDLKEASLYMGRTVCALREMIWAGKLPVVKDGRRVLLDVYDMDRWIERSKFTFTL